MSTYATTLRNIRYSFTDLKQLLAKATALRSGDQLAGVAAENAREARRGPDGVGGCPACTIPPRANYSV